MMNEFCEHTREELLKNEHGSSFLTEKDIWAKRGFRFEEANWQECLTKSPYFIRKYEFWREVPGTYYVVYEVQEQKKGRRLWANANRSTTKEPFTSLTDALSHVYELIES